MPTEKEIAKNKTKIKIENVNFIFISFDYKNLSKIPENVTFTY